MGYGSFSRKDVTGSVAKVDMDELSTIPVPYFSEALRVVLPVYRYRL